MHQFEFLNSIDEVPDTTEAAREPLSVFSEVISNELHGPHFIDLIIVNSPSLTFYSVKDPIFLRDLLT